MHLANETLTNIQPPLLAEILAIQRLYPTQLHASYAWMQQKAAPRGSTKTLLSGSGFHAWNDRLQQRRVKRAATLSIVTAVTMFVPPLFKIVAPAIARIGNTRNQRCGNTFCTASPNEISLRKIFVSF